MSTLNALMSCETLHDHLGESGQVILEATYFLPRQQRVAHKEFELQHIPGAQFFDIDLIADQSDPLPHMLPNAEQFSEQVSRFGIDNDTHVVIYDRNHFFAAARAWWMFRVYGHENVSVVDGGLKRWNLLQFPVTDEMTIFAPKKFNASFRATLWVDLAQMMVIQ